MKYEPTDSDWKVADELWERLEKVDRRKARTIVTSLVASSPEAVDAAKNLLADPDF